MYRLRRNRADCNHRCQLHKKARSGSRLRDRREKCRGGREKIETINLKGKAVQRPGEGREGGSLYPCVSPGWSGRLHALCVTVYCLASHVNFPSCHWPFEVCHGSHDVNMETIRAERQWHSIFFPEVSLFKWEHHLSILKPGSDSYNAPFRHNRTLSLQIKWSMMGRREEFKNIKEVMDKGSACSWFTGT